MTKVVIDNMLEKMNKSVAVYRKELSSMRAGRANPQLLDRITVDYYGSQVPINQVANISIPEPRIIQIAPWEQSMLKVIEKAIEKSDLGINPSNDGKIIRLLLPELTQERRKELVKQTRKMAEQIDQLNKIYSRMIEAMTVNMRAAAPGSSINNNE